MINLDIFNMQVQDMAGLEYECQCNRKHRIDIKSIIAGSGVIAHIPSIIADFKGQKILLVGDENTFRAAAKILLEVLGHNFILKKLIFHEEHLVPDERAIGRIMIEIEEGTSLIIALGSGTINDSCRYVSYKLNIPYIVVCTAPSMDGYASVVSPLIVDGVKATYGAVYPYSIVADIDILKDAPMNMIQAGLGDILGKYTALCDWKLANILKGEYYCKTTADLVTKAVEKCVEAAPKLKDRDIEGVTAVTEALIISGLAIGMVGNSRPASSGEHHISHFLEMAYLSEGKETNWLHGNYVGMGAGVILHLYRYILDLHIESVYSSGRYKRFSKDRWIENIKKAYGKNALNIIAYKEECLVLDEKEREIMMRNIMRNWDAIKSLFLDTLLPGKLKKIMDQAGAVYNPKDMGIDRALFKNALVGAKDVRNRYGVLQLLEDIGMLEEAAEYAVSKYY